MNMASRAGRFRSRVAFTLVELLVVIGIIAVLISILLPVLGSVRRQAAAVKCGAALREIGNAFSMYAMENKGYYPPMRCSANYRITFNSVPPVDYTYSQTYWMYFLAKYVSKGKFARFAAATPTQADIDAMAYAMRSVLWGCPNFVPINSTSTVTSVGGIAVVYTGYGMNGFPEYTPSYPKINAAPPLNALGDSASPSLDQDAVFTVGFKGSVTAAAGWSKFNAGRWYKQKDYTTPAQRALVADCRAYVLEAFAASSTAAIAGQADLNSPGNGFWAGPFEGETSYDFYRHGQYPKHAAGIQFQATGGKVAFNVLYADGHVSTLVNREEGFKAARMRFPG
jgi:prepilin-type processing-associated H-X9-DG protein